MPRPSRYKIVPAPMNGEPAALAYVRAPDGRYHAACLTVLSLDIDGRIVELTTFVLPELLRRGLPGRARVAHSSENRR